MKSRWIRIALASTVSLRAADIAEIRSIMANRVESGRAVGMVTGVIDEKGRQVVASGKVSLDGTQQPDGDGAALLASMYRRERKMPDPKASGTGAEVDIVMLSDTGEREETVHVHKTVKNDAEWKAELAPEEYAVARKQGTERAFTGRY